MQVIINRREPFGVPISNSYVFARNTSSSFLDGAECIFEVTGQLELEAPETLKCTKMRHYAATVAQVLSLDSREVEWLAGHLGHDVATHKHYYRLQESTIELCKVSKLLLAMDRGEAANWYGRPLDDIDVESESLVKVFWFNVWKSG
ncbi:hypothetical protein HOLleu_03005 [Holothuria leucospilota]|uniref:Uncharacterized protein n=1 Tax=Holothuria leucospilota TaxID=206669 RepID=A0A9Q1CSH7_HOLLE|nr:hypothetical protein HOLleu_03005 [Holothuria leucospilota]